MRHTLLACLALIACGAAPAPGPVPQPQQTPSVGRTITIPPGYRAYIVPDRCNQPIQARLEGLTFQGIRIPFPVDAILPDCDGQLRAFRDSANAHAAPARIYQGRS